MLADRLSPFVLLLDDENAGKEELNNTTNNSIETNHSATALLQIILPRWPKTARCTWMLRDSIQDKRTGRCKGGEERES